MSDYYSLNKAYLAPSAAPSAAVKETFQVNIQPNIQAYSIQALTTYNYLDKLRLPNKIHESMNIPLDFLVKDHSVPSKNILHFRDGTFTSDGQPGQPKNPIYIRIPSNNIPINSRIFISRPDNPIPHSSHVIGSPEGYSADKRHQYAIYKLLVLDKDGNERPDSVKRVDTDLIFLQLNNVQIPIGSTFKNTKLGVLYIFVQKPTDAQLPPNITTLKQIVDTKIQATKLLISFS